MPLLNFLTLSLGQRSRLPLLGEALLDLHEVLVNLFSGYFHLFLQLGPPLLHVVESWDELFLVNETALCLSQFLTFFLAVHVGQWKVLVNCGSASA